MTSTRGGGMGPRSITTTCADATVTAQTSTRAVPADFKK
jgi:hypothetical protein